MPLQQNTKNPIKMHPQYSNSNPNSNPITSHQNQYQYQHHQPQQFSMSDIEQLPCDTILRLDNHQSMMSSYLEIHDISFQLPQLNYGNQEQRQSYQIGKDLKKYFAKRHFYFSLFQLGIELDRESWYSVIAQPISLYLIQRIKYSGVRTLFQPFSGVGGFSVHAAGQFQGLMVNDLDPNKIRMLKNNLSVYAKGMNMLKIFNMDYKNVKPITVDAVFICPPWGGIDISEYSCRDLDDIMNPRLSDILTHCKKFSKNMVLQMPKNTNLSNLMKVINMCFLSPIIKIQKILVQQKISQLFIYIGDLKFTQVNPQVLNIIIKQSNRGTNVMKSMDGNGIKELKKDVRSKIKQQKYQIFQQIYQNCNSKQNKHVFFNEQ